MAPRSDDQHAGASFVYSFTVKGEPYGPAARPVLAAGGRADLCLVGYNLGSSLVVEAEVRAADGGQLPGTERSAARVALVERTATGIAGFDKLIATFDPAGLSAGYFAANGSIHGF